MGGTDGSFPGMGLHAAQALCEGTIAPGRACPIVHASFSRKFMYLVVEGAIPKYTWASSMQMIGFLPGGESRQERSTLRT